MKGNLYQTGYQSLQQHHAILSGKRLVGQGFVLMQDNDPKHTRKLKKQRRIVHPSTDVLAGVISEVKFH